MDTLYILGEKRNDIAVPADIVVIGTLAVLRLAADNQVLNTERAVTFVADTVNNQQGYFLKRLHEEWRIENGELRIRRCPSEVRMTAQR